MRRWIRVVGFAAGGFALAVAMAWAGFAVAGQRLSAPADPIDPVAVQVSPTASPTSSPHDDQGSHASGATASPSLHGSPSETPEPDHSGTGSGDDTKEDSGGGDD